MIAHVIEDISNLDDQIPTTAKAYAKIVDSHNKSQSDQVRLIKVIFIGFEK